jgi:hypothetical protein
MSENYNCENERLKAFFITRPGDDIDKEKDKMRFIESRSRKCKKIYNTVRVRVATKNSLFSKVNNTFVFRGQINKIIYIK